MTILPRSSYIRLLVVTFAILFFALYHIRSALHNVYAIISMPLTWRQGESSFLISSSEPDVFDLSFASYNSTQDSYMPEFPDLVPPVLHHIALGSTPSKSEWVDARDACLAFHPGWQAHLWTDENAPVFVRENFPELWDIWQGYKYPIQRIDALRYMVLYYYGGG
jgi:inositol phosphorylceramide mannosyltransferase catalytic subunit